MTTDDEFAEHLRARVEAAAPPIPVDTSMVIASARHRRASTRAGAVAGALAVTLGGWAGISALPSSSGAATPASERIPTPSTTDGGAPCGSTFALDGTDAPDIEVRGAVVVGAWDPDELVFESGVAGAVGDTLHVDVSVGPDVPDGPSDDDDRAEVVTMLVGPDGTVAFWTDPSRRIRETADASGTAPDGLYDAVDCRTGEPLSGAYRAYATTSTDGTDGGETLELAPVRFEPGSQTMAGRWPDMVPECGRPAPAELLADDVDADFEVTLDPGADLDDVRSGLHVDVTVTATGPDRLTGVVPQSVHAVLVDRNGMVVSQVYDPTRGEYDSGATFDVGQGESFPAEVYQWFASCPDLSTDANVPTVRAGTYDLYVYTVILASAGPDLSPAPRIAVGGPFPITLR